MTFPLLLALLFFQATADTGAERLAAVQRALKKIDGAAVASLVEQAEKDPEASIRRAIVDRLGRLNQPRVREMLERLATADPDARVSLLALERLRQHQARDLGQLFEKRLALARSANDEQALDTLSTEHQHWVSRARGATLPAFLEQAPPVFSVSSKDSLRVLAFGDFGQEGLDQRQVAQAAAAYHRQAPFDFGLTLGDNVVPVGVTSPSDPRWRAGWKDLYDPLRIPFYPPTGNHDWGLADSPAAEILYSRESPTWRMPALYYTFTAGPAQFFAVATNAMSQTQTRWLDGELSRSTARWKIVYGHHPIYSSGAHADTPELQRMLLPILRGRVQVYLAGHEHLVQHLKPEDGVHFLVAAAAGQGTRAIQRGPNTLAVDSFEGFTVFDIDAQHLRVKFVDTDGKIRYETQIQ